LSPNLLAVSSSPRRGGNSETLLKAFLEGASKKGWQGETVRLNELSLKPCQACDGCAKDGRCVIKDDMQLLYPKVLAARGLVLATPIYFGSVSAQLKIFIDRFQCWWQAKYPLQSPFVSGKEKRSGFLICSGALRQEEYRHNAVLIARTFFHILNFHYCGNLCIQGVDEKGAISKDRAYLKRAFDAGMAFPIPSPASP